MKYINRRELAEKMGYSNYSSFMNSKTNKDLLITLVDYIESEVIRDYEKRILLISKDYENKIEILKKEFIKDLDLLKNKYKQD